MVMSDTVVVEVMATSPKKNKNSSIRSSVQAKLVDERAMEHKLFLTGRMGSGSGRDTLQGGQGREEMITRTVPLAMNLTFRSSIAAASMISR